MADNTNTKEWQRTKRTTDLGSGRYRLEWLDENEAVLCSMEIEVTEDKDNTILANYNLMRRQYQELFLKPMSEEEIAMLRAQMEAEERARMMAEAEGGEENGTV